jgi:hypothetical protein
MSKPEPKIATVSPGEILPPSGISSADLPFEVIDSRGVRQADQLGEQSHRRRIIVPRGGRIVAGANCPCPLTSGPGAAYLAAGARGASSSFSIANVARYPMITVDAWLNKKRIGLKTTVRRDAISSPDVKPWSVEFCLDQSDQLYLCCDGQRLLGDDPVVAVTRYQR